MRVDLRHCGGRRDLVLPAATIGFSLQVIANIGLLRAFCTGCALVAEPRVKRRIAGPGPAQNPGMTDKPFQNMPAVPGSTIPLEIPAEAFILKRRSPRRQRALAPAFPPNTGRAGESGPLSGADPRCQPSG
jgi:hypothetical protein